MQIQSQNQKIPSFKNSFYNVTRELDSSLPLSRAVADMFGCDIPWILMANNKDEKKEKARKLFTVFGIAWLSPFLTLPLSNRIAMKYVGKLTNKFWSNNHKAIHISNEFLKNTDDMMKELTRLSKKTTSGPLEMLYNKLFKSSYKQEIDIETLLKSCNGDKEVLRQRLIKAKNSVLFSDCIFSFGSVGTFPFFNNEITSKNSGQKGFSAEMKMADKSVVEKRAEEYEKNKKHKFLAYLGLVVTMSLGLSLSAFAALYSKKSSKFLDKLRNNSKAFDYTKGIYMSRLPLFIGSLTTQVGYMLASRNKTERKDNAIRYGLSDAVFFGGDLLMASLFANLSDRVFKTKLRKDGENTSFFRKIFPKVKSVKQIMDEVEIKKIKPVNKHLSAGIFWTNLGLIMITMGYFIPKYVNKMIKSDVNKDNSNTISNNTLPICSMESFLKK